MKCDNFSVLVLQMGQTKHLMPNPRDVVDDDCIINQCSKINNLEEKDRDGRTLLINAAFYQRPKVVKYLVEQSVSITTCDKKGFSALHAAAQNNDVESAKILLSNGAEVNAKNMFGNTPLMLCSPNTNLSMLEILLQYGADPSLKNNYGLSACEIFSAYPSIIKLLQKSDSM